MAKNGKTGYQPDHGKNRRQQTDVQVDFPGKKSVRATGGWEQYRQVEAPGEPRGSKPTAAPPSGARTGKQQKTAGGKTRKRHTVGWVLLFAALLLALYAVWIFFLAPEPLAETPVGQAVAGLVQRNDKGEAIRAARETEKNEKPFALLRETPDLPPMVSPSAINLLVMARDVEANLYDTLLIVSMNPEDGAVRLVNIPRDLFVDYSEEAISRISKKISGINDKPALRKINAAHKLGKLIGYREDNPRFGSPDYDFTADLIEEMFSLSIDDFVFIHHESFRKLVDEFGGVTVDVARGMRYNDPLQGLHIDLAPGSQLLDGAAAEGFVRFRKGRDENGKFYEIGDVGRKENQNLFVKAFMDQHLTLGNLNRIIDLANRYTEFVETSVVGQKKVVQYTQVAKSLIAESFDITSIVVAAEYRKVLGASQLVLGEGLSGTPAGPAPKPVAPKPADGAPKPADEVSEPAPGAEAGETPEGDTPADGSADPATDGDTAVPDNGALPDDGASLEDGGSPEDGASLEDGVLPEDGASLEEGASSEGEGVPEDGTSSENGALPVDGQPDAPADGGSAEENPPLPETDAGEPEDAGIATAEQTDAVDNSATVKPGVGAENEVQSL